MHNRKEVMNRWCGVMEWRDRLGYLTAGVSLLVLGMLIFAHAWYVFVTKAGEIGLQSCVRTSGATRISDDEQTASRQTDPPQATFLR